MGVMARFWPLRPRPLYAGSCASERVMVEHPTHRTVSAAFTESSHHDARVNFVNAIDQSRPHSKFSKKTV
ncbi:hypothetical protein FEI14_14325 [Lacticaseibacillus zeae]|uniref:Uncharacterized protein n=1 Tax=Lacticaseibacillus zeae TaxID=57037 RepID=A0A5R8LMV0_LACZE|nr:hypothetical protein FEI14_14325 [Lacticaseibacillus zeae]